MTRDAARQLIVLYGAEMDEVRLRAVEIDSERYKLIVEHGFCRVTFMGDPRDLPGGLFCCLTPENCTGPTTKEAQIP